MNPIVKNILAVIGGWLVGSIVNMGLIYTGHDIMPIEGVDVNDMDALAAALPTLDYKYFIFPFLAHALGTLVGAAVAAKIAANRKMIFSMLIGVIFFVGGIMAMQMLPAPDWFNALDLIVAYFPMAWIGGRLARTSVKNIPIE